MIKILRFATFNEAIKTSSIIYNSFSHWPFQSWWWQKVFTDHFCRPEDIYLLGVYEGDILIAWGSFEKVGKKILFLGMKRVLGGYKVTDYGDIILNSKFKIQNSKLGKIWEAIIEYFRKNGIGEIQLDNVREDSEILNSLKGLKFKGLIKTTKQQVAPFIELPGSWDIYLQSLPRVKRKELKRKIRRLETQQAFKFCTGRTLKNDFDQFIRLHRLSDPEKKQFMSDQMKKYFWDLVNVKKNQWEARLCFLEMGGNKVSAALTFNNQNNTLLYASGYNPDLALFSVGLLLKSYLIKIAIEEKKKVFDFLVGDERYKYDLGGKDRQLYQIVIKLK